MSSLIPYNSGLNKFVSGDLEKCHLDLSHFSK